MSNTPLSAHCISLFVTVHMYICLFLFLKSLYCRVYNAIIFTRWCHCTARLHNPSSEYTGFLSTQFCVCKLTSYHCVKMFMYALFPYAYKVVHLGLEDLKQFDSGFVPL